MATFNNGESGLSVRTKLNTIINKVEGVSTIDNDINVDGVNLSPIASTIADTAVDIFVYDTRKDSDGGAWRKRTQHTSWYNETLNTATRGSRKEFPAVAVIVAETNQVTIYDGDDPDLPMWMVFNALSGANITTAGNVSAVFMMNGLLSVGQASGGYRETHFIRDTFSYVLTSTDNTAQGVVNRNTANLTVSGGSRRIADNDVNDVAMTVLPNAPIDAATGLPVPTIAVATDGGVSVIKDDGTVVDSVAFYARDLNFNKAYDLWVSEYQFSDDVRVFDYPSYLSDNFGLSKSFLYSTIPPLNWDGNSSRYEQPTPTSVTDVGILTPLGLHRISYNKTSPNSSMVNLTASDYNTGWMNGDIKLATLSDTDATNVTGAEGLTGSWATPSGYDNTTSGTGTSVTGTGNTTQTRSYLVVDGVDIGKTFVVEVTIDTLSSGSMTIYARTGTTGTGGSFIGQRSNALVGNTYTFTVTATTDDFNLLLVTNTNGADFTATCSVRLAEEDRSVNGNGLQVFGTVTKSAVATGADLVRYRFPSAGDYLKQPTNSDLDSSSYTFMVWFKTGSNYENIFALRATDDTGPYVYLDIAPTVLKASINPTNGTTVLPASSNDVDTNTWRHAALVYKAGSICTLYLDGEVAAIADVSDHTDTTFFDGVDNPALSVGVRMDGTSNRFNGDGLSLLRISTTIATPEQIKKIYEDEKVLFQDGAQATLYGSSDAVTALAYDDSTELLHVGTSDGRSVFQGLKRVDNTTTAVGAAISASNGLVADE